MAFQGIHISCGYLSGRDQLITDDAEFIGLLRWSRSMTVPGMTDVAAPKNAYGDTSLGSPTFRITASSPVFVAWGPNPDATKASGSTRETARILLFERESIIVVAYPGDRVAWDYVG